VSVKQAWTSTGKGYIGVQTHEDAFKVSTFNLSYSISGANTRGLVNAFLGGPCTPHVRGPIELDHQF